MHGPLSESRARRYFTQIGDAVNFLHAQNIAHRDIKMQNVLRKKEYDLASNRFQMVCKLADMGLATVIWTKDKGPVFLHTVAGTKFAFAPEILENDVYKKKKTLYSAMPVDIWAEGVILYEMLCKCLPFNPAVSSRMLELQKNRNFRFDRKRRAKPSEAGGRPPKPLPPLTEEVKHLIRMIFNPDPLARWTWREISRHPWIQRKSKEETRTG